MAARHRSRSSSKPVHAARFGADLASVLILPSERARFPPGAVLRNFATAADLGMESTESYAGTLAASFAHQRAHSAIKRKYHGSGTCQLYAATEKAQLPQSLMAAMPAGPHRPKHRFGCLLDRVPEKERRHCKGVETFVFQELRDKEAAWKQGKLDKATIQAAKHDLGMQLFLGA